MSTEGSTRSAREPPGPGLKGARTVLTADELRARIETYVEAVNRRQPEGIAALFTEDAVQADPASNPPNIGRAAITAFFEAGIAASESWTFRAKAIHTCAPVVAIDFDITVAAGGSTMVIDGIEVFTADDDGLFRSVYAYWDDADLSFP
jgi:steroid Delta-isomerase